MNQEVKEKWITALESGEFKQGKEYMCKEGSYCCLGVLSELYAREHGVDLMSLYEDSSLEDAEDEEKRITLNGYIGETDELHPDVAIWAGLPVEVRVKYKPAHIGFKNDTKIAWVNDKYLDFEKIAQLIREQL